MSRPTFPFDVPKPDGAPESRRWAWLAGVVALHGVFLSAGLMGMGTSKPEIVPPTVIGMLVDPPKAAVASPKAAATPARPKPRPAVKPKPAAKPPAPAAPPSERAPAAPPAEKLNPVEAPTTSEPTEEGVESASASIPTADLASTATETTLPAGEPDVEPPRTDAAHLNNPAPGYPALSRRFGEEGRVLLDVFILPDGRVGAIKLNQSSGFRRLDQAALDAVRDWRYVPARRGDEAIPFWYVQPVTFSLSR